MLQVPGTILPKKLFWRGHYKALYTIGLKTAQSPTTKGAVINSSPVSVTPQVEATLFFIQVLSQHPS